MQTTPYRVSVERLFVATTVVLAVASGATIAAQGERVMSFTAENEFQVEVGDYVLPAGDYRLEQVNRDTSVFALFATSDGDDHGEPVAMIDVWRVPDSVTLDDNDTEVRFEVEEESGRRVLRGWSIRGARWRIRDVVEAGDASPLTRRSLAER